MDILTLVLACSLHFDDQLVTALIHKVSDDNPFLVGDLVTLKTLDHLTSIDQARAAVAEILIHGGRPAVGLMGVPISWAARFGRTPDELFDACTNISVGSAALSTYAHQCSPHAVLRPATRRRPDARLSPRRLVRLRSCILRRLGDDLNAVGYVDAVLAEIATRASQPADDGSDPPGAASPILPPDDDYRTPPGPTPTAAPLPTAQSTRARTSVTPEKTPPAGVRAPPPVDRSR